VFSVGQVAASSRSGLLCQCRILATVSCLSGEEDYFMTVPIWRRRNKDGYIGQIMSCSIEICPSAFYIFITFCLELIEISSVSLFLCLLESSHSSCSTRYGRKWFENMFPWPGHTGRLENLRTPWELLQRELSLISNIARGPKLRRTLDLCALPGNIS